MSTNTGHEEDLKPQEEVVEVEDTTQEETPEELKERLAKAEELAKNYKIRAEKAEAVKKTVKTESTSDDLSTKDTIAIMKANVHEDDIDDVVEYARFKKISVLEALNNTVVKATLKEKEEFRKSAEMANTTNARKGSAKLAPDVLVKNLRAGEVPTDKASAEELFWARRGGRRG